MSDGSISPLPETGERTVAPIPTTLKESGSADQLWNFVARSVGSFVNDNQFDSHRVPVDSRIRIPLAFVFSYPLDQPSINRGILQRWTKDLSIRGVVGNDVAIQLEAALERNVGGHPFPDPIANTAEFIQNVPAKVTALLSSATTTLVAAAHADPRVKIGCVFGTNCNSAYVEQCGSIPKIKHHNLPANTPIIINTEWGSFDSEHKVLPRNRFDELIDRSSPYPGQQAYEKLVARLYLSQLVRLVLWNWVQRAACSRVTIHLG